jgi:predicted N-formylglutamate amidohydrolase
VGRRRKAISSGGAFTKIVVTCEHASNAVPSEFAAFFRSGAARAALDSHRGWDPGALPLARAMARRLHATMFAGRWSRLVVDLNRSPGNLRGGVLSEFMSGLSEIERTMVIDRLHAPHWHDVEEAIGAELDAGGTVLHLGVHSFTPVLRGVKRTADFALLYDPGRTLEKELCGTWLDVLSDWSSEGQTPLRLRRNYPYLGTSDGLTTHLRKRFLPGRYAGIEIEFNQALVGPGGRIPGVIGRGIIDALGRVLDES